MLRLNALLVLLLIASLAIWTTADQSVDTTTSTEASLSSNEPSLKQQLEGDVTVIEPSGAPAAQLTESEQSLVTETGEKHEFQAEITRLMDIIINSLYSKREIFIRELISNAADALDKVRYLALTNATSLADAPNLDIKIAYDREAKTLSITDTGVGMDKEDLIKNLGIVAKSGTSDFLEAAASGSSNDALSLIGQFGVGFYSVYLVADRVTVVSKKAGVPDQWIWESNAERSFTVSKDPRGNTLGRGTQIVLHMKEDANEFINEHEIKKLVERYSEFINYPIYLYKSKMVDVEPEAKPASEDLEVTEEDETRKEPAAKVEQWYWERLNDVKAIWTRSPSDISDDEYTAFYKTLTKDTKDPLTHIHFKAEGEITFRAILFIPSVVPSGMYDKFYEKSTALKLYVRRVLISDEFDDFLPRYLNFIRGVVDSEDLPLNVSRETLAQSKVLRVMAKKLTRKVLEMIRKLSDANKTKRTKAVEEGKADELEEDDYDKFWNNYGKSIKLGVIDDRTNKAKLTKFLRFYTSKSNGKLISLDEYVDRMKSNQRQIYYITGESIEAVKSSPFVEKLEQKDLEVVYMVDPVDEYLLQSMTEYEGTSLVSITKEGLTIDDQEEKRQKAYAEEFQPLTTWLSNQLGSRVTKVTVSSRVATSPMVIVTGQFGWSSNMERIMAAQTFANNKENTHMRARKTLEINPRHPVIRELQKRIQADENDEQAKNVVELLYDAALLQSGFMHESPADFAKRIHRLTAQNLQLDPEAPLAEEIEVPADEPAAAADEELDHEEL